MTSREGFEKFWADRNVQDMVARGYQKELALAAWQEADALHKELTSVDPFSGGRDGDMCLWCNRDKPRNLDTFEQNFDPEYHDADCGLMVVTANYRKARAARRA